MRLALLVVGLLLAGGAGVVLAYANPSAAPLAPAQASEPASAEVDETALLPRAREEVEAFGEDWRLQGVGSVEAARDPHGDMPGEPDPRPGNGLAPFWGYTFVGPDGYASVALKADGKRAGVAWSEEAGGHPDKDVPALSGWAVASDEAVRFARDADEGVASFLDDPRVELSMNLANVEAPKGEWSPVWRFHAWHGGREPEAAAPEDEPASSSPHPRAYLAFTVHAQTGDVTIEHFEGYDHPDPPRPRPHEPCCSQESRLEYRGDLSPWRSGERFPLYDAPPFAGSSLVAVLTFSDVSEETPGALTLRVLDANLEPLGEVTGKSPLRLEAADLPAGPLYLDVRVPSGEVAVSTRIELTTLLTIPPPPGPQGWEEWMSFYGEVQPARSPAPHFLALTQAASRLSGTLFHDGGAPAMGDVTFRLRVLDASEKELAAVEGPAPLSFQVEDLPAGEYWLHVTPQGSLDGAPALGWGYYDVEVRAFHPYQEHW